MHSQFAPARPALPELTTEEFAAQVGVKPQSIRVQLCRRGSYFGIRPTKLPNRRLLWPADAKERLLRLAGEAA